MAGGMSSFREGAFDSFAARVNCGASTQRVEDSEFHKIGAAVVCGLCATPEA